ncbi:MAG: hypothetical protein CUN55_03590 [Phototrophicales bacterium]|nr:MAG: hypothetical protein CUN55_03590 [Phototrophicales bacterium]
MSQPYRLFILLSILLGMMLIACTDNDPIIPKNKIAIDSSTTQIFDFETSAGGFEVGQFGESKIELENGAYQLSSFSDSGNHYLVGKNQEISLKDVAVEVTTTPISGSENNWYGIVCRTDDADTGYALLISADGFWSIAKITQSGNRQFLEYLQQWREDDNIRRNQSNTLLAYCVDNYLALYVNGEFLGDYEDQSLDRAGGVGFLAGGTQGDTVIVAFDNANISSVSQD